MINMRKLIVSMNLTLDGFMSGKSCELDWHFKYWSPEMAEELAMQLSKADSIFLGRKTFEAMAAHWPQKAMDPTIARDDLPFVEMMNRQHWESPRTTFSGDPVSGLGAISDLPRRSPKDVQSQRMALYYPDVIDIHIYPGINIASCGPFGNVK